MYLLQTHTNTLQDQYTLCHEAVANFLDSFDTYANFKEVV